MTARYAISQQERTQYAGVYLLERMINTPTTFPLVLDGRDTHLEGLLEWLFGRDYVEIVDNAHYAPSDKGREVLKRFFGRYSDSLKTMDIYGAVDLAESIFAFEKIFDFDDEALWHDYIGQENWDDLRVAVAVFKGLDPVEIIFMSFVSEERFDDGERPWQIAITDPEHWQEMETICNTALTVDDLAYEGDDGPVRGDEVLKEVIRQGAELNLALRKQEDMDSEDEDGEGGGGVADGGTYETVEEVVVEHYPVSYYEPYLNPLYVAPIWAGVWLL